jgi:hypothetical protein
MKRIICLTLTLIFSVNAYAYTLNRVAQAGARWRSFPIDMTLNPRNAGLSEAEVLRVISSAMNKWNEGIEINVLDTYIDYSVSSAEAMDANGVSSIAFSKSFRNDSNGFDPDVTVAVGGQYGDGSSMSNGFVIFNAEAVAWDTDQERSSMGGSIYRDDLETIAIHELGHVLGLGHSEDRASVMSDVRTAKVKKDLAMDDISGGKYLASGSGPSGSGLDSYSGGSSTAGCGSIGNVNSAGGGNMSGMAMMILLPIMGLIFARRRVAIMIN